MYTEYFQTGGYKPKVGESMYVYEKVSLKCKVTFFCVRSFISK